MHVACEEGYADVVRHLIECGADKDKARSDDGATPLLLASLEGHLEVVRTLLEASSGHKKKLRSPFQHVQDQTDCCAVYTRVFFL